MCYIASSAGPLRSVPFFRCWANLSNATSSAVMIPMALLFAVAAVFLLASIFAASQETVLADLRNR